MHLLQESRQCLHKIESDELDKPSIGGLTECDLRYFLEEAEFFEYTTKAGFYLEVNLNLH